MRSASCFFVAIISFGIFNMQSAALKPNLDSEKSGFVKEYKYESSALLIFLDQNEDEFAIGLELTEALDTLKCPIITTTYLLGKQRGNPNIEKHIIKKINDQLYLLIPKDYIKKLGFHLIDAIKHDISCISDIELNFGLKVNHMETINASDLKAVAPIAGKIAYFNDECLKSIFCTNLDYFNANNAKLKSKQPEIDGKRRWFIFISGHGGGDQIVGISLSNFSNFLDFLEKQVTTQLLVYLSCYAAGVMANKIYANNTKTYNFAIITAALTDAQVWINPSLNKGYFKKFIESINEFDKKYDYALLVKDLLKPFPNIFEHTNNYSQIKMPGSQFFYPIGSAGIKSEPAVDKSSNVYADKTVVTISKTLAQHRDPSLPLNILKYFKVNPTMLALDAQYIPFEIVINNIKSFYVHKALNLQTIASIVPGDAIHIIKKINTSLFSSEVMDKFGNMNIRGAKFNFKKIFFIKEIYDTESDADIYSDSDEKITDVVVFSKNCISKDPNDIGFYAIYKNGEKIEYGDLKDNNQAKTLYEDCIKLYENFMNRLDNKPIALEKNATKISESIGSTYAISNILKANKSSSYFIFEKIMLINDYMFFKNLLELMELSYNDNISHYFGLIFFKSFKCNYQSFINAMADNFKKVGENAFEINGKTVNIDLLTVAVDRIRLVELNNIIIDGFYNKLFFTYKDKFYEVSLQNTVIPKVVIATTGNYLKKYPMLTEYLIQAQYLPKKSLTSQHSVATILHTKLESAKNQSQQLASLAVSLAVL